MRSWKLGRAFGIDLFVHWSFLLLPAFVFLSGRGGGLASALLDVVVVLAVFGCVLLHELGHALAARGYGIGTRDITLYPIGGVARLDRMSERPMEEVVIALAGPAVNVVIAAGLLGGMILLNLVPSAEALAAGGSLGEEFVLKLLVSNVALVIFNLIPAFPMDGGRVLRAALAMRLGRVRATEMAVSVAKAFAALFVVYALFGTYGSPMLLLIAPMILLAGWQELAMVRARERFLADREEPLTVRPVPETYEVPPAPDFTGFAFDRRLGMWVQWRHGRPVGACSVGGGGYR